MVSRFEGLYRHEPKLLGDRTGAWRSQPLQRNFGLENVFVVTMQAVSGAGYPGVASLDILGNVIPYIGKEEEKMEEETRKLLGSVNGSVFYSCRDRHERAV